MTIRRVRDEDYQQWYRLRLALWPDATLPEDKEDMKEYLTSDRRAAFVAEAGDGQLVGFLEANIRDYADGCRSRNVGYIEGWYVDEEHRRQGVGAALVREAETWARSKGCMEIASDCLLENDVSLAAHTALGYEEVERLIHFVKQIQDV
jgi:aminoglycoside 6'-N-acetyltransferase I